jgi:Tfp pilus assembly protein PilF
MNEIRRAIFLSILLITWFVINAGYVINVQADNEGFKINVGAETAEEWNENGISFGKSGEYEKAIECFGKAIELDPNYVKAYNNRGNAYSDLMQYERAIEDYNKAIELDPNYVKAYNNRGNAYENLGCLERAKEDFEKAKELNRASEIREKNISIECSLNYDIFLNNSARATIYLDICNEDENDLFLGDVYLKIMEVRAKISNSKVIVGRKRTDFNERHYNCSSVNESYEHIRGQEYSHFVVNKPSDKIYRCFYVGMNRTLGSHRVTNLYISYLIDDFVDRSEGNIKCLYIPSERFNTFWVIPYNKYKMEDGKLKILPKKHMRLQTKSYNILINFPHDRYHYSQLETVPHPYPDVIAVHGNAPMLSWHFVPNNRNTTPLLIPTYEIKYDRYMITLDALGFLAITLGFFSIFLTLIDHLHKWRRLRIIVVLVFMLVFYLMIIYAYSYMIGIDHVKSLIEKVVTTHPLRIYCG